MGLDQLSERYAEHNRSERGAGFVFARPEREVLFRRYVDGPGHRVLDLGCRDGALTQAYVDGNEVVGVDADREALAEAAKLGIETRWADVEEPFPFEDANFDVVVAGELLEHVREPAALVGEARRVLRPGGRLLFIEHVRSDEPELARFQDRMNWLNRLVVQCDCNRPTLTSIEAEGFNVSRLERTTMPKAPKFVRPLIVGVAVS